MLQKLENLYREQLKSFELAGQNFANLKNVVYRTIHIPDFDLRLQYNPARILSTNAKIDAATLQNRPCFFCPGNQGKGQEGISYNGRYHIFVNPYPIFEKHFTVPSQAHTPQAIAGRFTDMLDLAFDLPGYTLFYNGPQCGASAPDHFHFQIAPRQVMPIEQDAENNALREILRQEDYYSISTLNRYLRKVIIMKASDRALLQHLFDRINDILRKHIPSDPEPMYNLLTWFDNCQWTVCIFPRKLLRPWQFFAEGNEQVMFSPGSVDMAGLIITPRQEDFDKYSDSLLADLFAQVTVDEKEWQQIVSQIQKLSL